MNVNRRPINMLREKSRRYAELYVALIELKAIMDIDNNASIRIRTTHNINTKECFASRMKESSVKLGAYKVEVPSLCYK